MSVNTTLDCNELSCRSCNSKNLHQTKKHAKEWFLCRDCLFHQTFSQVNHADDIKFNDTYEWGVSHNGNLYLEEKFMTEVTYKTSRILKLQSLGMVFKTILDVGCGAGPFLEAAKKLGIKAVGIEPSLANAKFSQAHGHKVFNGFVEEVQLDTGNFDAVNMEDVFNRLADPIKALERIRSHLTEDGYLFWQGRDYFFSPLNITSNLRKEGTQINYLSKSAVANILGLTGFKLIRYRKKHGCFDLIAKKADYYTRPKTPYLKFVLHYLFLKNCFIWDRYVRCKITFKAFLKKLLTFKL